MTAVADDLERRRWESARDAAGLDLDQACARLKELPRVDDLPEDMRPHFMRGRRALRWDLALALGAYADASEKLRAADAASKEK